MRFLCCLNCTPIASAFVLAVAAGPAATMQIASLSLLSIAMHMALISYKVCCK